MGEEPMLLVVKPTGEVKTVLPKGAGKTVRRPER